MWQRNRRNFKLSGTSWSKLSNIILFANYSWWNFSKRHNMSISHKVIFSFTESCIYGDYKGLFENHGNWKCSQVIRYKSYVCYEEQMGKLCCGSCNRIRDTNNPGKPWKLNRKKTSWTLLEIIGEMWMGGKWESLNRLLEIDFNWFMMMAGLTLASIQNIGCQTFYTSGLNLFTKATIFIPAFRLFQWNSGFALRCVGWPP